ncbi:MAG TPA: hypothetical protein VE690_05330, partial [Rhodopila sp.]|nr:hypothetical protein [Rhodopila sp.]
GQYYFGMQSGSDTVAAEGHLAAFQPLPILDDGFNRLLSLLDSLGIDTVFLAMPVNDATWNAEPQAVRERFRAYLASYERRYTRFHVITDTPAHWPNRYFGDQFCHLNPEGAERFSTLLAQRLQAAPPSTQKDAQNGWFSATDAEASRSVAPISKRGS